jgi:hypothetical protein
MLIRFLSAYVSDKSVRDKYIIQPRKILEEYGVTEKQLKLIAKEGLEKAVSVEIQAILTGSDRTIKRLGWGIEDMFLEKFEPRSTAPGKSFQLTVWGEEFTKDTRVAVSTGRGYEGYEGYEEYEEYPYIDAIKTAFVSSKKLIGTMPPLPSGEYMVGVYRMLRNTRLGAYTRKPLLVGGHRDGDHDRDDHPDRSARTKPPAAKGAKAKKATKGRR